jgi:hypothetical protein
MEIKVPTEVSSNAVWSAAVSEANGVLRKVLHRAPHPPIAAWRLTSTDPSSITLDLSYFEHVHSTPFALADLQDLEKLQRKLFRIWGKVIIHDVKATTDRMVKTLGELREELREPQNV